MYITLNIHIGLENTLKIQHGNWILFDAEDGHGPALMFRDEDHLRAVVKGLYDELFPAPVVVNVNVNGVACRLTEGDTLTLEAPLPASHPANLPPYVMNTAGFVQSAPGDDPIPESMTAMAQVFDDHAAHILEELREPKLAERVDATPKPVTRTKSKPKKHGVHGANIPRAYLS